MLSHLLGSSARAKLISLFVANPHDRYYLSQVSRLSGVRGGQLQAELARLVDMGVLARSTDGNRVYYRADEEWLLLPEFKRIVLKATGAETMLRDGLGASKKILAAFVYGSYASDRERSISDIDLIVIGGLTDRELHKMVAQVEEALHRRVNYILYSPSEYRRLVRSGSGFLANVLKGPKIFVRGDETALRELGE